jgi:hypothetical protein
LNYIITPQHTQAKQHKNIKGIKQGTQQKSKVKIPADVATVSPPFLIPVLS